MDLNIKLALVVGLFAFAFILNVPMGALRSHTRKFSISWFLCVHATIPVIYMGRLHTGLDLRYVPLFVAAAILGQIMGGRMGL